MPTTLLTGANGFVGATVLADLIAQKHTVLAVVRSTSAFKDLLSVHPDWPTTADKLDCLTVADFTVPGAFDGIFQSHPEIDYVLHVAAPVLDNPANTDFVEHFEKPSILGNLSLLQSAKAYGTNVKAVAVVSSINAITTGDPTDLKSRVIDSSQWLPLGRDEAISMQNAYISYCVGKKVAEQTVWKFVEEEKPAFTVTVFNMPIILGPVEQYIKDINHLNWSIDQLYSFFNGKNEVIPPTTFPGYIDVRDLSALLLRSLTTAAAANKRFIIGHGASYRDLSNALRRADLPALRDRLGRENGDDNPTLPRLDTSEVEAAFVGFHYRSMEATVVDGARRILELEKRLGGRN